MSDFNENENGNTDGNVSINAETEIKKLEVGETLTEGLNISLQNIGPIFVNLLLWALTIWIPYLNVGTTIGLFNGIIAKLSRGETISYTEIFDPKYRKYMGDYFITLGLISLGFLLGLTFMIIPGIVIIFAWNFATILVIDKGKNPSEAITLSNSITYGNKGRIFLINIVVNVIFSIAQSGLFYFKNSFADFLLVIVCIFQIILFLGIKASMYKQLAGDV